MAFWAFSEVLGRCCFPAIGAQVRSFKACGIGLESEDWRLHGGSRLILWNMGLWRLSKPAVTSFRALHYEDASSCMILPNNSSLCTPQRHDISDSKGVER